MSEVRERFNANNELKEYFMSGIKKITGIIPVIKEEKDIRNKLMELQKQDLDVTEQVKSLKTSLKLLENEEKIKKAIEEIISIKAKELEKIDNEIDKLKSQLAECVAELEEYIDFIHKIHQIAYDSNLFDEVDWEKFSKNEFIAYILMLSDFGKYVFPKYSKEVKPIILHEVIDAIRGTWDSFIKWIEEN